MSDASSLHDFFGAWGETDAVARRTALEKALAETFAYSDPRSDGRLTTLDRLADYVGQFGTNAPGWTAQVETSDGKNGFVRAVVRFGGRGPDGTEMTQRGTYFAELDDEGRIATLAGFVGTEPG